MDSFDSYIQKIQTLEAEAAVNELSVANIRIWPLIRLHLLLQFKNPSSYGARTEPKKRISPLSSLKINFAQALIYFKSRNNYAQQLRSFDQENKKKVKFLLFSESIRYKDKVDEKAYNRLIDPIYEFLEKRGEKVAKFEFTANENVPKNRFYTAIYFDKTHFEQFNRSKNHFANEKKQNAKDWQSVKHFIDKHALQVDLDKLRNTVKNVLAYERLFSDLLGILKPEYVFCSCYYTTSSLGLMLASKKLAIKTIDIQHGKQGNRHIMYSHWTKIPAEGYQLLPDYHWNWGEASKKNIDKWYGESIKHHLPVVGGNLWLGKWFNTNFYQPNKEQKAFIAKLKSYEKVILYTLQPFEGDVIPDFLAKAVACAPPNWMWLFRMHPLKTDSKEWIKKKLSEGGNYEVKYATEIPLYELLHHCQYHITCWSSVCMEALQFNVPSIIIHETGLELYEEYVKKKFFVAALTTEEVIRTLVEKSPKSLEDDYIQYDEITAEKALRQITGT